MKSIRKQLKPISFFLGFLVLFVSCEQYDESIIATPVENKLSGEELFKSVFFGTGHSLDNVSVLERQREFISKIENSQKHIFNENIDKLIKVIEEDFPLFFNSFKQEIMSGDHYRVESSLDEGAMMLRESVSKLVPNFEDILSEVKRDVSSYADNNYRSEKEIPINFQIDKYDNLLSDNMLSDSKNAACSIIFFCAIAIVFYAAVAVHNHAAIAGGIVLFFAYWGANLEKVKKDDVEILTGISFSDIGPPDENWALYREMLIDELANKSW